MNKHNEEFELSYYKPDNYFDNQKEWVTEYIPLNPRLRENFDATPNDSRDDLEVAHWWGKPYIEANFVTLTDRNYFAFTERMKSYSSDDVISEEEWNEVFSGSQMNNKECNHGAIFVVRCLDGGAWDRSTWKGQFNSLTEAISCAEALLD